MSDAQPQPVAPSRRSAATREAILQAARGQFMARSYDQVDLRDIASDAGITATLVIRYFGSKERLFDEMLTADVSLEPSSKATGRVWANGWPAPSCRRRRRLLGGSIP